MKKITTFIFLMICSFAMGYGNEAKTLPTVVPMSPNAASISIYADYPVSYYTGVPNISIPLYEITIDNYKLPISLSYHASGILVSQEASWVGLGWTLNVGGNISRTVKGYDDFLEYPSSYYPIPAKGYYDDKNELKYPLIQSAADNNYYFGQTDDNCGPTSNGDFWVTCAYLKVDVEPDIFYYSLPGASGKFLLNKSGGVILFDKSTNVKVEVKVENSKHYFIITTPDGTKYIYKDREITESYSASGSSLSSTKLDDTAYDFRTDEGENLVTPNTYTSNWYLSKIITPNKREISFIYTKETCYRPTQVSLLKYDFLEVQGNYSCGTNLSQSKYSRNKAQYDGLRLSEIRWDGGKINFVSSDREDMTGQISYKPKKLDKIEIYNVSNQFFKGFKFEYDYFNKDATGQYAYVMKRLKLNNVTEISNQNGTSKLNSGHTFRYFEGNMPAKNFNNVDFWGYNNGSNYSNDFYPALYFSNKAFTGVDKRSNFDKLKIGTLNEIKYPTGESCLLTYETNTFTSNGFSLIVPEQYNRRITTYNQYSYEYSSLPAYAADTFTVCNIPARIIFHVNMENYSGIQDPDWWYNHESHSPVAILKKVTNMVSWSKEEKRRWGVPQLYNGGNAGTEYFNEYGFDLQPGTYIFECLTPPKDVSVNWQFEGLSIIHGASAPSPSTEQKGGGLRIASIQTGNEIRQFKYSGGLLMTNPSLHYITDITCMPDANPAHNTTVTYLTRCSQPVRPMASFKNGNIVGYNSVEELTKGGKIVSEFYNEVEEVIDDGTHYPFLPTEINYYNGLPKSTKYYRYDTSGKTYVCERNIEYAYQSTNIPAIYAYILQKAPHVLHSYVYAVKYLNKSSEVITDFIKNTNNDIVKASSFLYNNYNQLSSSSTYVNGDKYETKILYSSDLTDNISRMMADSFMIGIPVETLSLKNDLVVSAEKTEYQNISNMFLPKTVFTLNTSTPSPQTTYQNFFKPELFYDSYNMYGKVVQIHNNANTNTIYLWSYNYQYPIAKIENATYAEVETAAKNVFSVSSMDVLSAQTTPNETKLQNGSLQDALPNALVTTYTYKPLTGIKTATDPRKVKTTYEYDAFGRLQAIKDHNGNTIESYNYHYKNP